MGSQAAPVRRSFVTTMRSGAPDVPRETERLDPTDTGVMAKRRLAPFVSEEEEGEYQRYSTHIPSQPRASHITLFNYYFPLLPRYVLRAFCMRACVRVCF
jgi:hypothetical protein